MELTGGPPVATPGRPCPAKVVSLVPLFTGAGVDVSRLRLDVSSALVLPEYLSPELALVFDSPRSVFEHCHLLLLRWVVVFERQVVQRTIDIVRNAGLHTAKVSRPQKGVTLFCLRFAAMFDHPLCTAVVAAEPVSLEVSAGEPAPHLNNSHTVSDK